MSAEDKGEVIIYQSEDGNVQLDVRLENETVWLTQDQFCMLFNKAKSTISEHISNIFKEGELDESVVVRKFRITTQHGAIEGKTDKEVSSVFKTTYRNDEYPIFSSTIRILSDAGKNHQEGWRFHFG